jgi:hypothetical protein
MVERGLITGIKLNDNTAVAFCQSCMYSKAVHKAIPRVCQGERATEPGGEVHTDVWGPAPVELLGGRHYYVSFTDDKTRYSYLALVHQKSDVPGAYRHFEAWLKAQFGATVKILQLDQGGKYQSEEFSNHLVTTGTVQKLTIHDTPEFNGIAKRLNRTLLKHAQAMLHASGLPRFLWGTAVLHACWIKNCTAT